MSILIQILLITSLLSCGDNIDSSGRSHDFSDRLTEWLTENGASHGTVYVCDSEANCPNPDGTPGTEEWCYWADAEQDLEAMLGAQCHEITVLERSWPALVGCAYACPGIKGCNAHCGCFCPVEGT